MQPWQDDWGEHPRSRICRQAELHRLQAWRFLASECWNAAVLVARLMPSSPAFSLPDACFNRSCSRRSLSICQCCHCHSTMRLTRRDVASSLVLRARVDEVCSVCAQMAVRCCESECVSRDLVGELLCHNFCCILNSLLPNPQARPPSRTLFNRPLGFLTSLHKNAKLYGPWVTGCDFFLQRTTTDLCLLERQLFIWHGELESEVRVLVWASHWAKHVFHKKGIVVEAPVQFDMVMVWLEKQHSKPLFPTTLGCQALWTRCQALVCDASDQNCPWSRTCQLTSNEPHLCYIQQQVIHTGGGGKALGWCIKSWVSPPSTCSGDSASHPL